MSDNSLERAAGNGWLYLYRPPTRTGILPILLLHGLTGDEQSMWVLQSALPGGGLLAAPRGVFESDLGGYSWLPPDVEYPVEVTKFQPAVAYLDTIVADLQRRFNVSRQDLLLMGFSQGSAAAFATALEWAADSRPPAGIIAVAGILPKTDFDILSTIPVYWGHGVKDHLVPVERAREAVERLRNHGVEVDYCEADVGHKLGAACLKGVQDWFGRHSFLG